MPWEASVSYASYETGYENKSDSPTCPSLIHHHPLMPMLKVSLPDTSFAFCLHIFRDAPLVGRFLFFFLQKVWNKLFQSCLSICHHSFWLRFCDKAVTCNVRDLGLLLYIHACVSFGGEKSVSKLQSPYDYGKHRDVLLMFSGWYVRRQIIYFLNASNVCFEWSLC